MTSTLPASIDPEAGAALEPDAVEIITSSADYAETVAELVERTGRTDADIRADAATCLQEMAAQVGPRATDAWDRFGRWLTRSYDVDVDGTGLAELREIGRRHSLVFLPNHRSYLDPLVLRAGLQRYGFPPNHILGGINLAIWPLSNVAKRSGLVFIRRSTRDDPVYPAMLRLYLGFLLRIHANLEWYFEGGRTRTGKLRPPRMGVLRYLVDAFTSTADATTDVYVVPVAIVYDQQAEVEAISHEESGGTKTPESISWLVGFARAQSRRRGRAHLRFGPPLSLREAVADAEERAGSGDATVVVPRVAFEIANRINAATPVTPSALVTFALLDNDDRAMTLGETLGVLEPVLAYIRHRGLPLTHDVDLARPEGLRRALRTLVREGVVSEYAGGTEPVFSIQPNRQHEAGFYRNTVTHYFVTRAIVEVATVAAAESGTAEVTKTVWSEALRLRDLLKYEFFFARKRDFDRDIRVEVDYAWPGWTDGSIPADRLVPTMQESHLLLSHRVVGPFLEAYSVIADLLAAREPAAPLDEDALVQQALGVARQRYLQQQLHSPESISKDLMKGALRLAGNRNLLGPGGEDLREAREAFATELAEAVRRVQVIRTLARDGRG